MGGPKEMANKYAKYEVTYATATNHCNRETFNTMVEARNCWNHHQAMHDQMKASQIWTTVLWSRNTTQQAKHTVLQACLAYTKGKYTSDTIARCNLKKGTVMVMYEVDWQAYRDAARNDYFAKADYVNRLIDSAEHIVGTNYYIRPELNKVITDASLQCKEAYHQLIAAIKGR